MLMSASDFSIVGKRFGRLLVIERSHMKCRTFHWLCQCDCGRVTHVPAARLKNGRTKSCGCLRTELFVKRSTKHGHAKNYKRSPTLGTWDNMLKRCLDTDNHAYNDYGGRGIKVCDRWLKFENFLEDMGEKPDPSLQLERIDNDGHYEPGNCEWATRAAQSRNRRSNHRIPFNGKLETVTDVADMIGMNRMTLFNRILTRGWSVERAIQTPVRKTQSKARIRIMQWER